MDGGNQNPNFLFYQFVYLYICPHVLKPRSGKNPIIDCHDKSEVGTMLCT